MKTNDLGIEIIKSYESCSLSPYKDAAGHWTVGWGHKLPIADDTSRAKVGEYLAAKGLLVKGKTEIEQETADALLLQDIAAAEQVVTTLVRVPLTANQFSALVSFAFNVGSKTFAKGSIDDLINGGNFAAAEEKLHEYKFANKKELEGLRRRRAVEAWLFGLPVEFTKVFTWEISGGAVSAETLREAAQAGPDAVMVVMKRKEVG
jgi:lysozyme